MARPDLPRFLQFLEFDTNVSRNTVKAYESDIKQFFSFNDKQNVELSWLGALAYLSFLRDVKHSSDNTIKRRLASMRRFFHFLEESGLLTDPRLSKIGLRFRTPFRLPRVMPLSDVSRLLQAAERKGGSTTYQRYKRVRDHLILSMLFYTGMRVGEVVGLVSADIEMESGTVRVHGKGGKERILYIRNRKLGLGLRQHAKLRSRVHPHTEALFINRAGNRLSSRSVEQLFHMYLRRAGIVGEYTPHTMRHTMATALLERGTNIRTLQETLGHASILSTQIYTHVAPRQVEEALAMLGRARLE
jgi:site-specific recombinase XerD